MMSPAVTARRRASWMLMPSMFHRIAPITLAAAALLAVAAGGYSDQADISNAQANTKIQLALRRALEQEKLVPIIVSLREPAALRAPKLQVASLRRQVAAAQLPVLASVSSSEFRLTYKYDAVPALAGKATASGIDKLAGRPEVTQIDLDGRGSAALAQSVPLIHADEAQDGGLTGQGIVVAVLDTGIDTDHPDLADGIAYERCFLNDDACPAEPHPAEDQHGHGTNVAGIVTSNGTVAPRGVAPDAKIAAYRILNAQGSGSFSDWLAALNDIIANHPEVNVVNMSLQSGSDCAGGGTGNAVQTAISTLRSRGVPVFVSSGNHGNKTTVRFPACVPDAIAVGASYDTALGTVNVFSNVCSDVVDAADQIACWSDSFSGLALLAPGGRITSAGMGGGTSNYYGTSQASPHAAGVAALLLQAHPGMSADEVERRMRATGKLLTDQLRDIDPNTQRTTPRIDARVALLNDNGDTDGDGCTDGEELGTDASRGGQRNPLDPSDFYDVNGDGTVNLFGDVLPVIQAFGPSSGPHYAAALDRSPAPLGVAPWHLGPPDGVIDMTDIAGVIAQFGHSCAGMP